MSQESNGQPASRRSTTLLVLTSLYGLLYLVFMASGTYGSEGSEPIVVRTLFVLFLSGYVAVWRDERIGGVVFILWWVGQWYLALFVARTDRGAGVAMGLPLVALGILFIVSWYGRRRASGHTG